MRYTQPEIDVILINRLYSAMTPDCMVTIIETGTDCDGFSYEFKHEIGASLNEFRLLEQNISDGSDGPFALWIN